MTTTPSGKRFFWEGVYQSFAEVPQAHNVFAEQTWLTKQVRRAEDLFRDVNAGATLPLAARTFDYALAVATAMIVRGDRPVRILDFGGGLATTYVPLRASIPRKQSIALVVVENAELCDLGGKLFAHDKSVRFESAIPDEEFDLVHAGSSMQYVDDWKALLARFARTGASHLLFADLPAGPIRSFVTAQLYYGRKIPVRFWNVAEFCDAVAAVGYELLFSSAYHGYYLERDESLPTQNFALEYRLESTCQLIFRRSGDR